MKCNVFHIKLKCASHVNVETFSRSFCPKKRCVHTTSSINSTDPDKLKNHRDILESIATQLNIKSFDDWYKVSLKDLKSAKGGTGLVKQYHNSQSMMLSNLYPEYNWQPWKFSSIPKHFWNDVNNQRKFLQWLVTKQHNGDWYKLSANDISQAGGLSLLLLYKYSVSSIVLSIFPELNLLPWKFTRVPPKYWTDLNNQKTYMHWLQNELSYSTMEDWYSLTWEHFQTHNGLGLIKLYGGSPSKLLMSVFPEYDWQPWKFLRVARNFWDIDKEHRVKLVEFLREKFNIKEPSDWFAITRDALSELGISTSKLPELMAAIQEVDSEFQLDRWKSIRHKKTQFLLKSKLETIFPGYELLEEYRHPDLVNSEGIPLEIDLFYPDLKLAFEFHGGQHYDKMTHFHNKRSLQKVHEVDKFKEEQCKKLGITLIAIPYWWDTQIPSLKATINLVRPELLPNDGGVPIAGAPPAKSTRDKAKRKETVSSQLILATDWDTSKDPTGWLMSEKYDGVRAIWTGGHLFSRSGRMIPIPEFFRTALPPVALDGELWIRRGLQQEALSLLRTNSKSVWEMATFHVFDTPDFPSLEVEERLEKLRQFKFPPFISIVDMIRCTGKNHLLEYYQQIVNKNGEGVMLRHPDSPYEPGRSDTMCRYKEVLDTEVRIVASQFPHGFECEQFDGQKIFVGIPNELHTAAKQCKVGAVITVKYSGKNLYNKLIQPEFYRKRSFESWEFLTQQNKST